MIDPVIVESRGPRRRRGGLPLHPRDLRRREPARAGRASRRSTATGNRYRKEATGLKARAIQHEIDHLDGILFLDHLSLVKRQMLLARYRREHKDDTSYTKEVQPESARLGVMRIVFFGTPEFAVPSLRALLRRAVPGGRAWSPSRTSRRAARAPRWSPRRSRRRPQRRRHPGPPARRARWATSSSPASAGSSPTSASWSPTATSSGPRCSSLPPLGMINVHASLLPRWRGAAPIQHAILAGDTRDRRSASCRWRQGSTAGRCCTGSRRRSARTRPPARWPRGWRSWARPRWSRRSRCSPAGLARPEPQDHGRRDVRAQDRPGERAARLAAATPRRSPARCARSIPRPAPGPRSSEAPLKLFGAGAGRRAAASPGSVLAAGDRLVVACGDGALAVREVQPAGKTRLAGGGLGARARHRGGAAARHEAAAPAPRGHRRARAGAATTSASAPPRSPPPGPAVALHARDRAAGGAALAAVAAPARSRSPGRPRRRCS